MTIEILVKRQGKGFQAIVKGLGVGTVEAPTREEAIAQARHEAEDWVANAEHVYVEVDESHHLPNDGVGILADDPFFDEFVAEMKSYREQIDAIQPPL